MTPLTFGNPLKFGPDSHHNTKGRPTFLHRDREPNAPRKPRHTAHTRTLAASFTREGPPMGPLTHGSIAKAGGETKAHDSGFSLRFRG